MLRWLGLWRPIVGRARSDWQFLLAIWLLIASAVTLLTAGTMYAETVEIGGLRRALSDAPLDQQSVLVRTAAPPTEVAQLDDVVRPVLADTFAGGAEIALTLRSTSLRPAGEIEGPVAEQLIVLGAYEGIDRHAALTEGRWPVAGMAPFEAALSAAAAERLGLAIGDRLAMADASLANADPNVVVAEVVVVGVYEPAADDPYWRADTLELTGSEGSSIVYRGPLVVDRADLLATERFRQVDLRWRVLPLVESLRVEQLPALAGRINSLPGRVAGVLPANRQPEVATGLAGVLGGIDRSALVSRSGVVLTTLQFAVVAGYAVVLVGAMLLERRRREMALLRARGATTGEVALLAFGEAALVALPAALVAPFIAVLLVNLLSGWDALAESGIVGAPVISESVILVAAAGGLACVLAMTLTALISQLDLARVRAAIGRPLAQTAAQRLGIDLVLLILAAIGLYQLQTYGAPLTRGAGGTLALDPLLVAAPAIALAAAAVLVVRLVPRIGQLAEFLTRRRRGAMLPLSARGLARRPLRYTRAALLIVLAAALGTFGAIYASTWGRSQADQAAYQAGADVRATLPRTNTQDPLAQRPTLEAIAGVEAATPVLRELVDVGRVVRRAPMLGLEPNQFGALLGAPAGPLPTRDTNALAALAAARSPLPGIDLPADTRRVAVVLDATLVEGDGGFGPPPDDEPWPGIHLEVFVQLADGTIAQPQAQQAFFQGKDQRLEFALPATTGSATPRVVEVQFQLFARGVTTGDVALRRVEASPSASGADWAPMAELADFPEGAILVDYSGAGDVLLEGATLTNTPSDPYYPFFDFPPFFRWQPTPGRGPELGLIASRLFLEQTGVDVGDTVELDWFFNGVVGRVVAVSDSFPTLDPGAPWVVTDTTMLSQLRYLLRLSPAPEVEWWLLVADDAEAAVTEGVRGSGLAVGEVVDRVALTRSLERDPIALGMVGALALGSVAAAALAVIAFVVTAVVAAREQLDEYALLRALGTSRRQVVGWLTFDHAFLLLAGLLAGGAIGALIAVLVVPYATLNQAGVPVVPPPVLVVPWDLFGLLAAAALVLLFWSVLLAAGQVGRRSVIDVLREQEV